MEVDYKDLLNKYAEQINIPSANCNVFKEECVYSFDTPECDTGLFVCLKTHYGVGKEFLERHHRRTGSCVYLLIKHDKIPLEAAETEVTRLAIGVEGGFDVNSPKFDVKKSYAVVVLPDLVVWPWPDNALPEKVKAAVNGVISAESPILVSGTDVPWDGEVRRISKLAANLVQINNGKRVPPTGWKCEKCDMTTNLWLNLTDGSILCGRKYYDSTGGNNHACENYEITKYPLAVKLGTITKDGRADVYSYEEGDMVIDPLLPQHLAHFGIDILNLEKSDKSMAELELDLNKKFGESATIQESGTDLKPVYGPGYTGLRNLGNSCYLNSTVQVLFAIPNFVKRYFNDADEIFADSWTDPIDDFNAQMSKLAFGLLSGKYSAPPKGPHDHDSSSISPRAFKRLIGKDSVTFAGKSQQDVPEFFLYLVSLIQRNSPAPLSDPTQCFKVVVEDRIQCSATSQVSYTYRDEYCLPLTVCPADATNMSEVADYVTRKEANRNDPNYQEEPVRPRITLTSCIEAFTRTEVVDQFFSTGLGGTTSAYKTTKIRSFPPILALHLKKYVFSDNWLPLKLDVSVDVPDIIDLSSMRGIGLQPGEVLLPSVGKPSDDQPKRCRIDSDTVNQLMDMGFTSDMCKRAVYYTENSGLENATNWLMLHLDDPTISDAFVIPESSSSTIDGDINFVPDEASVKSIMNLGCSRERAIKALKRTQNNVEHAADWIFSNTREADFQQAEEAPNKMTTSYASPNANVVEDQTGPVQYRLKAFISHIGPSSNVGHYVCHILRDERWVIYNDEKVALSEKPPKDLGYVYFFEKL